MTMGNGGKNEISIVLTGWRGRMEKLIAELVEQSNGYRLSGYLDVAGTGGADSKVPLAEATVIDDIRGVEGGVDVVIDFSAPDTLRRVVAHLAGSGVRLVSGTTGIEEPDRSALNALSQETAVFYDSNMSYGISVMRRLLSEAKPFLAGSSDIEIVEYHHSGKKDFPSGTTFGLARAIDPEASVIPGRASGESPPSTRRIHAQSIRIGGLPGQHDVYFATQEEVICISHRALSRSVFARGALRAARFTAEKGPGMYSMEDLTGV
jgi:4-hydroxy-tetrahydrodipicolinate reductase